MYEYKIGQTDLGYIIFREKPVSRGKILQYLYSNEARGPNKILARIFYHKEAAESALVVVRSKDEGKNTD